MAINLTRLEPFSDIARFEPFGALDDWMRDFALRPERYFGEARRTLAFERDIDDNKVTATYTKGVLALTLPKKPGKRAHQVTIN